MMKYNLEHTLGELNSQAVAVEIVTISASCSILSITFIRKGDESKCRRSVRMLDINVSDASVPKKIVKDKIESTQKETTDLLVKQVVQLRLTNINGQVSNEDTSHF